MDRVDKKSRKEKKHPRVPIKTYRWEDIRRSRKKGGYPWTYLYKQPFDEDVDPEPFTMEALRKSKSSSTIGKSDGVEISEITSDLRKDSFGGFLTPEKMDTLQIITEPDDHSRKNSTGSLVIEECEMSDAGSQKPEPMNLESADSSDNISQYLDKEERIPDKSQNMEETTDAGENHDNREGNQDKASEETKRKRKLSAESSYSKMSLTKSAVMKKLRDTKNKIKVPKITFPTSKLKRTVPKKTKNSPPEVKKDIKKSVSQPKIVKPVYIHIPLKPPPGETDEFSYLADEKSNEKPPPQAKKSFKELLLNIKQLQDTNVVDEQNNEIKHTSKEDEECIGDSAVPNKMAECEKVDIEERETEAKSEDKLEGTESMKESKVDDEENTKDIIESESDILKEISDENKESTKNITESETDTPKKSDVCDEAIKIPDNSDAAIKKSESKENEKKRSQKKIIIPTEDLGLILKLDKEESLHLPDSQDTEDSNAEDEANATPKAENEDDVFDRLFKVRASSSKEQEPETKVRSKSAEPERKRKLSLESSYSRKSLSKLGILKKLKEASDKIKHSLSRSNSKKKPAVEEPIKKEVKVKQVSKPVKKIEPVYIRIPLKPPEGETDEFSYLEYGEKPLQDKDERNRISSSPESPGRGEGVQFIMVTAPSDDEILDDSHGSDVPETPSSENKVFFGHKLDELKELAKDIVDEITPANKLESVSEETISDKVNTEKINDTDEVDDPKPTKPTDVSQREKITVDVEDGLSEIKQETQNAAPDVPTEAKEIEVADQPVELKSNLKGENSPVMKKKVSFRRRSKTPKDGGYEDIQAAELPADVEKCDVDLEKIEPPSTVDLTQSMSVDEEKTYLEEKIIKSTSLEEDYNKWSKISDHEYEPVNPPPDNEAFPATPTVHITDTDPAPNTIEPISDISLTTASTKTGITKDGATHKTEPTIFPQVQISINSSTSQSDHEGQTQEAPISDKKEGPGKFQLAFKQKTDQFKSKLQNIKRPHITMPDRSKLRKFKIERPKFNLPKIPDTARINLPSFSLPRRSSAKRSLKERQQSTESNDGDSKKQIFDFSTYPRIFKKKPKNAQEQNQQGTTDFATVPRSKKSNPATVDSRGSDIVRIPLHSDESMEVEGREDSADTAEPERKYEDDREDSVERRMASHIRYGEDIDIDDEYERENHEINKDDYLDRWHHGSFNPESNQDYLQNYRNSEYKVTDLDSPEDPPVQSYNFNTNNNKDNYSSGSSFGAHRERGVLEEINSDEFFLRQKGISQDNIEVGIYLSSEIREAFRTPDNALSKIQDLYHQDYELRGSNQSLPEIQNKRKPIKKPKRKKTPHASQEKIPYDEETGDEDLDTSPPSRPKRRSKRVKKPRNFDDVIPYQETISVDTNNPDDRLMFHRESLGILGDDEGEVETNITYYENEQMEGKDQPEIKITDPYRNFEFVNMRKYRSQDDDEDLQEKPAAPPRKQKSLKSLNLSENDSILEDFIVNKENSEPEIKIHRTDIQYNIPLSKEPPKRPSRIRSRTNSQSRGTSQQDDESISHRTESLTSENQFSENQIPCVEEPCVKDIRDHMGYAIIDKQKPRDPPLPPPRPPNRHKRSIRSINSSTEEPKFFTVPRSSKDESMPVRPLRNYSTLGQTRKNSEPATYENKENIDIIQYIEIDDEPNRDLQSGDVIKKMKDRPLPAPPRPPRKSRPLRDITSKENIMSEPETGVNKLDESEMSTQTEPLGDNDFLSEEDIQTVPDPIPLPPRMKKPKENVTVERRLITPTYYTHEETVTHGTLLVQPLNNSKIIPDSEMTLAKEKIIPINVESDTDETSTVPDDFKNLRDPPRADDRIIHKTTEPNNEESVTELKAQKLKISDLDVDTLTVNKLLAGKIVVSEIDSSSIQTNEISSKSGTLKIGEIGLPPGVIEQIIRSMTSKEGPSEEAAQHQEHSALGDEQCREQKKTPMDFEIAQEEVLNLDLADTDYLTETENVNEVMLVDNDELTQHQTDYLEYNADELQSEPPQPPPRSSGPENVELENVPLPENYDNEFPQRPPRQSEKLKCDSNTSNNEENVHEPDVDDEPPPRPPQPQLDYLPSQPPASFYALRAQQFLDTLDDDNNIPVVPRRRRQPKSKPISGSSSEESSIAPVRRFHGRPSEPSISQLSGQLFRACGSAVNGHLKRLMTHLTNNVLNNADGKQDIHVMMIILLVLIAGLILLGYGDEKTVIHLHHWEYFNPPKDM